MSQVGADYETITKDAWAYIRTAARGRSARRIDNRRRELLKTISASQMRLSKVPGYEGDITFRDAVLDYLKVYYAVLNDDYAKIMDLEEVAEQSYDAMEAYLLAEEIAQERLHDAFDVLDSTQRTFATAHNVSLIEGEDKTSTKLRKASEASAYQHRIFLLFFKAYHQEQYFLAALQEGNLTNLQQSRSAMLAFAEEGISQLETVPRFNNDLSLKKAGLEALQFFKSEAGPSGDGLVNYFLAKQEFDEIKALFDETPSRNRTRELVNEYNTAVDELNKASATFNESIEVFNQRRKQVITRWEKATEKFYDTHVPR
ncbi:MAG TPA: hypothetical protein DCR93_08585 [Cytophagales bacterium]|nr:hypothetical protein [Cytophagales bacterium]HAP59542.1 hypothetical protein [Cytophagales bacterium]